MRLSPQIVERASRPFSASPRPFLKWAGSKRFLLSQIVGRLPAEFGRYYEPFLGSGSLFFAIAPSRATLGDTCQDLINTYLAVRENSPRVMGYLHAWKPDEDFYYQVRNHPSQGRFKRAAEFIYLNKTCWNGLYRVNLEGRFNVPYGRPKTDNLIDKADLAAAATALARRGVSIRKADFEETLDSAGEGDLVYLDPPYVTGHNGNGFLEYNQNIFSWKDQVRLAKISRQLVARGAFVVVSNANHPPVVDLYRGFERQIIHRMSTLASDLTRRRAVTEVLLYSKVK